MTFQTATDSPSSHSTLSLADRIATTWQDAILLIGRILMGWIFFQSGWGKIFDVAAYAKTFPGRGLAPWMAYVSVPAEFLGGLLLIVGLGTRHTILVMLFFMVIATFSSHAYWTFPEAQRATQTSQFWKNVSITGGLLFLFVTSAGKLSLDHMLSRRKA